MGMLVTLAFGFFLGRAFLGTALLSAVVYVWSKRHPETQTSFYGFGFKAAYLPFVLLGGSGRGGRIVTSDLATHLATQP